jgi:hypothetical protein
MLFCLARRLHPVETGMFQGGVEQGLLLQARARITNYGSHNVIQRGIILMSASDVDWLPAFSPRRQFVNRIGAGAIALALGPVAGSAGAAPPASTDLVTKTFPRPANSFRPSA